MRNYGRFIPGEEIKDVAHWQFGAIDTAAQLLAAQVRAREAQEQVAQGASERQQAYQEGYVAGVAQGKIASEADLQQKMQAFLVQQGQQTADKLTALFDSAQHQLVEAEQEMAQGVLVLACELARQVLRRELKVDTAAVMPVLTEAMGLLGAEHKAVLVRLNPLDLAALGGQIQTDFAERSLTLRADPDLLPGGCLVESAGAVVDASVPKRWQRAVATLGLVSCWEIVDEPS